MEMEGDNRIQMEKKVDERVQITWGVVCFLLLLSGFVLFFPVMQEE